MIYLEIGIFCSKQIVRISQTIQASLFAQMGFDGLFFGRLDYADKSKRKIEKTMEMIWKASQSLYQSSWLFTGALFNGYGPPEGFCFDDECQDEPIMDDPRVGFTRENLIFSK